MNITTDTVIALDLELNQPSTAVIQVGAVAGNYRNRQILGEFCEFVNPCEALNPDIVKLTGITQKDVDGAELLADVYQQMLTWLAPFRERRLMNPVTWGGGDSEFLQQQLGVDATDWPFGRRWFDAKTLYQTWRVANDQPLQGGLSNSMTKLSLSFDGRKHNALADSRNTFRIYCALMDKLKEKP